MLSSWGSNVEIQIFWRSSKERAEEAVRGGEFHFAKMVLDELPEVGSPLESLQNLEDYPWRLIFDRIERETDLKCQMS
jgi:hypothetical protein